MVGLAIAEECEPGAGDGERERINLVETEYVAGAAEAGGDAGTKSDNRHADRAATLQVTHGAAHPRKRAVVTGGLVAMGGVEQLSAVIDSAVDQAADRGVFFVPGDVANTQDAVEVAHRQTEHLVGAMLLITQMDGQA